MLRLVLSSSFASTLYIVRGDNVSDQIASCRDNDAYPLCTHSYAFRMPLERLTLFSSTRIRGIQCLRRTC